MWGGYRISSDFRGSKSMGGCSSWMWTYVTCCANLSSSSTEGVSRIKKRISKRDNKAAGRLIFSTGEILGLYLP
jgi:hypothetical protein